MNRDFTVVLALSCVLLTTLAQISLKLGVSTSAMQSAFSSGNTSAFLVRAAASPLVITGLLLYVLSTLVWLLVLARADVSYAYPFVSLGFVLIAAFAYFFLNEPMGVLRMTGITLICAGVWLVAKS